MAPRYMSERVNLLLTLTIVLIFVISTASTKQCTSKKTERDSYVIKNIGIKLCHLKCAEHGECATIEYDIETLTCRLSRNDEKKEGDATHKNSHSHVPTDSCTSSTCRFGQRCLKTRSGKEVCVQASTDLKPNTVSPASVTTQDSDQHVSASTCDGNEDLTPCKTFPIAPVTTQGSHKGQLSKNALQSSSRLFLACKFGHLETVKRILAAGHVNLNSRGIVSPLTPVMTAAKHGHKNVVEVLVGRGADVSMVDRRGNNILHLACMRGDLETVKLILSMKVVDINARNRRREAAADIARRMGHQRVVDLLVSCGAH